MPDNCPFDVQPYSQSDTIKNDSIISLNYTNQDFWSMKARMVDFLKERFGETGTVLPNTFNDFVESSVAIMLIENMAFVGDTLSFKQDQQINEIFIDTVTEPDNAFRIAKAQGFTPTPPIPARTLWTATINSIYDTDVTLSTPVTVEISTDDGVPMTIELFQPDSSNNPIFDEDIIIPAGAISTSSIVGLEGTTRTDNFTGTGEVLQSYTTVASSVIFDSITVKVDGIIWDQVDYFTDSQPRREFRVEYDSSYNAYIMFGNNTAGLSPSNGSVIEIKYRIGGGTRGNIVTGFVQTQKQAIVSGLAYSVPVILQNYTRGEYGYDGDTIEDIRRKLPIWNRTQDRAVSGSDYKSLADQFATPYHGQVGKATAVLRNHGCAGNVIDLYILAKDGDTGLNTASDDLKVDLYNELEDKKMITDIICIKNGTIITADIIIEITLLRVYKKFELEIREKLTRRIDSFFDLNNWDYNQDLKDSDLIKKLSDITQLKSLVVNFITNDENNSGSTVVAKFYEIIRPGDVQLSFIYE